MVMVYGTTSHCEEEFAEILAEFFKYLSNTLHII